MPELAGEPGLGLRRRNLGLKAAHHFDPIETAVEETPLLVVEGF